MSDAESPDDSAPLFPRTVGEKLKEARIAAKVDLAEVAAKTRIPIRHLESIERSSYSDLPSQTYAIGFTRAYARAIGADEVALARELRVELDQNYHHKPPRPEPQVVSPSRLPGGGLVIGGVVAALIVVVLVIVLFNTSLFRRAELPAAEQASTESELGLTSPTGTTSVPVPAASPAAAVPTSGGHVTLTATDEVWMRIYDSSDKVLFQNTMKPGDRYEVPTGADRPMINVGRPDQLTVTINGSQVAPLGSGRIAIKDIGVSADALRARAPTAPESGSSTGP